jgi:hypothetical protein
VLDEYEEERAEGDGQAEYPADKVRKKELLPVCRSANGSDAQ